MNKFTLKEKSSETIQKRLLSIQPVSEKKRLFEKIIRVPSIVVPVLLLLTIVLAYIILFATSDFNGDGFLANGEVNSPNLKAFEFNEHNSFLGTNSFGRDNSMVLLNSAVITTIDFLFVILFSSFFGTILNLVLRRTNLSRKYLLRYSSLEGLILFPLFLLIASIFFKNNYWAIILLISVPITITFESKLEINLRGFIKEKGKNESKLQNYYRTNNFTRVTLVKWAQTFFESLYKGIIFYIFWTSIFTYLDLLNYGFPYLLDVTFSLGSVLKIAVDQVIENPLFLLFLSSVLLGIVVLISIIGSAIDIHIKGITNDSTK